MSAVPIVKIVPFVYELHVGGLIESLLRVKEIDSSYPPNEDLDSSISSYRNWLLEDTAMSRHVLLINEIPRGHIALTAIHSHLSQHFAEQYLTTTAPNGFAEISKFFVHPEYREQGYGTALLDKVNESSLRRGFHPALSVTGTSEDAIKLYNHENFISAGSLDSSSGKSFIYFKENDEFKVLDYRSQLEYQQF